MTPIPTTGTTPPALEDAPKKPRRFRLWLIALVAIFGSIIVYLCWPDGSDIDPISRSREDGKSRFWVTSSGILNLPRNTPLRLRLWLKWMDFQRRYRKPNPASFTFPGSIYGPTACSLSGMLNQSMTVTGTRYFIAVEACGATIRFGPTNTLGGAQWVADLEHTIETSDPVICYDYAAKTNFQDTLLLIRERPGIVKVIPRTKLADYQKAGLVKIPSP